MSRLNGRVGRLEQQAGPSEQPIVMVGRDMAWDLVKGEPYDGDLEDAYILTVIDEDIGRL